MGEPAEVKAAVLTEVPTKITATQVIAVILALAACRYASGILAPLLVAILSAVALAPLVRTLTRVMPRWLASAIVVFSITAAIGVTAWALSDEVATFSRRLPSIVREIRETIQSASPRESLIRQLQQAVTELEQTTTPPKTPNATPVTIVETTDVQGQLMTGARTGAGYLAQVILLIFLIYFLLSSGELFKQKFVKLSGERLSQKKVTVQMIDEITSQIGSFVFYQFWSGIVVGLLTWGAFAWLGVRYAGLWGVAAGVLNCIPYFGPTIIMIASAVAAVLQFKSAAMVGVVSVTSLAITSVEGFLLAPIALGRAARVNTVAIFVSVMFWGWMWGSLGLILAVPVLMIIKTIADHVESLSGLSELLGDRTS
ncbi:MAG TPA: AI-2E family transporter [Vicinamibacterales bacterium]